MKYVSDNVYHDLYTNSRSIIAKMAFFKFYYGVQLKIESNTIQFIEAMENKIMENEE